jgi:hypothetical protein
VTRAVGEFDLNGLNNDTILYLSEGAIACLIDIQKAIELVEQAFTADGKRLIKTFPVISHGVPAQSAGWVMKSGAIEGSATIAKKDV